MSKPDGPSEAVVVGGVMQRSIAEFVRACEVLIAAETEKASPDTALIGVLCDAVRLSRECRPASLLARSRVKEELEGLAAIYRSLAYSSAPMHSTRDALQWATKVIAERLAAIEKEEG